MVKFTISRHLKDYDMIFTIVKKLKEENLNDIIPHGSVPQSTRELPRARLSTLKGS